MAAGVAITSKVNALINAEANRLGMPKEALVHWVLLLGLTDPAFMARVPGLSAHLDHKGSDALEKKGL
jgi:hypothetical protein